MRIGICRRSIGVVLFLLVTAVPRIHAKEISNGSLRECSNLSPFQYKCDRPVINPDTQQPQSCQPDNSILLVCRVADGISCNGLNGSNLFELRVPESCHYNAHVCFSTTLLLSIFLGFFGIDRMYLGYYSIGLFKMFSMGGLFILWLTDIVLIALQLLLPADGTFYKMPMYGPKVFPLSYQPLSLNSSYFACNDCY